MQEFDISLQTCNTEHYSKRITALVIAPDACDAQTGLMHFAHGWGGNRFQYRDMQRDFCQRYNLVCVATEYRQSGYHFNPVTGAGADVPYDFSHYQVLDCLCALRAVLGLFPGLNRQRFVSFGGSQGGHVAILMTFFCPGSFALAVSACGISHVTPTLQGWAGRHLSEDEVAIRDVVRMAPQVHWPVVLMHGTADTTLPDIHTRRLETALRQAGKEVRCRFYEGGGHGLEPVTNRHAATIDLADDWLRTLANPRRTEFDTGATVTIPCVTRKLVLDWSKPSDRHDLMRWE